MDDTQAALVRLGQMLDAEGYAFVTPTPATHALVNARAEAAWATDLRGVFGWSRPFRAGVLGDGWVGAMRAAGVLAEDEGAMRSTVRFSRLEGRLFAHSAFPTRSADSVFFGPDTYRFAAAILRHGPTGVRRAVDIGCGAGPGAVLAAAAWPEAEVFGVDINDAALRLTEVNAALAGVTVRAVRSDLLSGLDGVFDLIVANPPYLVDPGARVYRHGGGPLGAGLSLKILDAAIDRLAPGGTLLLYTGVAIVEGADSFRVESQTRLQRAGLSWTYHEIDPDVFGEELLQEPYAATDRIAAILLTARQNEGGLHA